VCRATANARPCTLLPALLRSIGEATSENAAHFDDIPAAHIHLHKHPAKKIKL